MPQRPQFVVQKHDARRLHYDFRLEHDGVLKSWAIPKGPSLAAGERRLAVRTEDHPIDYATFEGVIPEREYGAGAVLVWDRGHWVPDGDPSRGLDKGKLDFTLHGEKLRGRWTLVRLSPRSRRRDDDNWLLIKRRDAAARAKDAPELVDLRPESVLTGRSIDVVAADRDRVWHSRGDGERARPPTPEVGRPDTVPGAAQRGMPRPRAVQRPAFANAVPDEPGWLHEPALRGARVLCWVDRGSATVRRADGGDLTRMLPAVETAAGALPCRAALLDGIAAVLDEKTGRGDEARLEKILEGESETGGEAVLVAFDLLYLDGWDLRAAELRARKELLRLLLADAPSVLRYGDHIEGRGAEFFREACRLGLGGVVSKRADAKYRSGTSRSWLVTPCGAGARAPARARSRSPRDNTSRANTSRAKTSRAKTSRAKTS